MRRVQPVIDDLLTRIDFAKIHSGWTFNYTVLAGLRSLAYAGQ